MVTQSEVNFVNLVFLNLHSTQALPDLQNPDQPPGILHGVLARPLLRDLVELRAIGLVDVGCLGHQRVGGVGVGDCAQ